MIYYVRRHRLQAVISGNEMVLAGKLSFYLLLLLFVQCRRIKQIGHIFIEILVGQLQFGGDAVFVVQGGTVAPSSTDWRKS